MTLNKLCLVGNNMCTVYTCRCHVTYIVHVLYCTHTLCITDHIGIIS